MTDTLPTLKPFIAAFDIATATGVCHGRPGCTPALWTWDLGADGKSRPEKLCRLYRLLTGYFGSTQVDAVYYEQPTSTRVLMDIGATDHTVALLRGAVGVLEALAMFHGIPLIGDVPVQAARQALTGQRTFSKVAGKSTAKERVMATVKMLGVEAKNDNEADAYAVWWYACALHNPRIAHLATPLFMEKRP